MADMRRVGHQGLALLLAATVTGCGAETRPLLLRTVPLNGSTLVELGISPVLELAGSATVDATSRRLVLYDITAGARKTVSAVIEAEGSTLTYKPKEPLPADHSFELAMERETVAGSTLDEVDASEWPEEPIAWPYRLWFSTASRPRVRAAYLEREVPRITIYFSQPMDPVVTSKQIEVLDLTHKSWPAKTPAWDDSNRRVRLELAAPLDPATPYILRVGADAVAENTTRLDGNDDGIPGGPEDSFSAPFTGSQAVISSRQRRP
jgi:hypothetical protein